MDGENEERNLPSVYAERITRVEERIERIGFEQRNLRDVVEKTVATLDSIANKINSNELTTVAIHERTEQHSRTIEHLQAQEVDTTKILLKHENDIEDIHVEIKTFQDRVQHILSVFWNALKLIVTVLATLTIGYLFSHFIH